MANIETTRQLTVMSNEKDPDSYTEAKSSFIKSIIHKAKI